jgi:gliding motility-associated-like protein
VATANVQQPAQLAITPSAVPVTCNGGSDGSINLSVSGGTTGYAVVWSPSVGSGQQLSGLTSGSYTATVTDGNGCIATQTINVSQPAALQLTTTTVDATCGAANGSAGVTVTGGGSGYSYTWSPGGAIGSNVNNLAAGNYTVTVTDNAGCTTDATVAIANAGAPTLSVLSSNPTSCNGGSDGAATISAAGGSPPFAYAWAPSGGTGTSASGLSAGTYQVSVTDSIGCISYVSVTIQEPAPIQLQSTASAAICTAANGSASISATGGNGGYTYNWSPAGGTGPTTSGIISGTYTVTVTDQNGCTQSTAVTVPNAGGGTAISQAVSSVSCNGGSDGVLTVSMSGGTAPYQYTWQPGGGNSPTVSGLAAGSYSVTVTDANGCIATAQSVVTEPTALNALTSTTPAACNGGTNGTATVTVAGGTGPYSYLWTPSGGNAALANGLSQGVYGVIVTDANGCTLTASAVVNNTANINVALSTTDVSCAGGSNGTASFTAAGGTPPYSYAWSPNGSTGTAVNGLTAGSYQVTITDMMGCSHTELLSINEPAPLNLTVSGSDTLCLTQTAILDATVAGGTAPYTYSWNNGSTSATQTVSPSASTSYSVIVTDANGCTFTSTQIPVGVYPPLQASATGSDTLCPGNPFTVSATANGGDGNYSYTWGNSTFNGTGFTVTPQQDSLVSVTVTDGCGQSVTNQVLLVVAAGPQVNFTPFMVIDCAPVTVHFNNLTSAPAGSAYAWDFGDQQSSSLTEPVHTYDRPGIYSVSLSVTSQNGCEDSYTIPGLVEVSAGPSAGFTQSATEVTSVDALINFTNGSTGAVAYQWFFGDGSSSSSIHPSHQYNDTGLYQVQLVVTNEVGCLDTVTGYVHVTEGFNIYIPNAFTPNGDQVNDFFLTFGYGFDKYDMYILDRWGLLLFHSTDPETGWDGTVGGNGETPCQNDVYEFIVIVRDFKGERHRYVGHVTLVR